MSTQDITRIIEAIDDLRAEIKLLREVIKLGVKVYVHRADPKEY